MLFNLFGKKEDENDKHVFVDRAYASTAAKLKACAELAGKDPGCLFICWFDETMSQFKDYFKQQGLDEERIVIARYLNAGLLKTKTPVFTEHYPLHTTELELIKTWDITNIVVYSALDEPLFKHFGSDKIIPVMKMMGMKEDAAIEHSLVTKSIIKGQEKIAEQVSSEHPAISQAEWMRKNVN